MNSASSDLSVSIIIPTYNRAHLIGRAVQSVLAQVRDGDAVIVVDDGSKDATEETLTPLLDRIVYIRKENAGASAARNRGVKEAKTHLVAFLDSDDEWMPGKLELQRRLMAARPDVLYCFSDFCGVEANGEVVHSYLKNWLGEGVDPAAWKKVLGGGTPYSTITPLPDGWQDFQVHFVDLFASMLKACCINTVNFMVRREEAGEALHFDEDLRFAEDWLCYTRVSKKGTGAFLNTETAWQYGHSGPRLTDVGKLVKAECCITVLELLMQADPEYFRQHREGDDLLAERYCSKAAALIRLGRTQEARAALKRVPNAPLSHKLMAALPGALAQALLKLRSSTKLAFLD